MKCENCGHKVLRHVEERLQTTLTPIIDDVIQDPQEGELIDGTEQDEYIQCDSCYMEYDFEVDDDMKVVSIRLRDVM